MMEGEQNSELEKERDEWKSWKEEMERKVAGLIRENLKLKFWGKIENKMLEWISEKVNLERKIEKIEKKGLEKEKLLEGILKEKK